MLFSLSNSSMLTTGGRSSSCPGPVGCGWWWWSRARRPDDGNCWAAWEPTDYSSLPSVPWRETNTERLGSKVNKVRCYVFNGVSGIDSYPGVLERVSLNGALGLDCPWGLLADKTNDSSSSLLTRFSYLQGWGRRRCMKLCKSTASQVDQHTWCSTSL